MGGSQYLRVVVWAATGADYFWPLWPIGIGLTVVLHALELLGSGEDRPA